MNITDIQIKKYNEYCRYTDKKYDEYCEYDTYEVCLDCIGL